MFLTVGNGADVAVLILGCKGMLDLEALACSRRDAPIGPPTRTITSALVLLWLALLLTAAGQARYPWYLLAVGLMGSICNIIIAGAPRQPQALGFHLERGPQIDKPKVMAALLALEEQYPGKGNALRATFFPGELTAREARLWEYCQRRKAEWKRDSRKKIGTSATTTETSE